ncbi:hypothetical protein ACIBKY_03145 [Nonomuraea sp. NPDC050394]|uniref:hypothetical protein n=1 Tax=Nonomuraea sp. NPDC050394 TaxID=3364363 RepID=UPI00379634A2
MDAQATPVDDQSVAGLDDLARQAAAEFGGRIGTRRRTAGAPLRKGFVSTEFYTGQGSPPLANLLRGGGRGGQLRLKLYLSLLWLSAKEPYDSSLPARAWAALLGLADHETRGVRRVQEAIRDLESHNLISVRDRGGHPSVLTLLDENGQGQAYLTPSDVYSRLQSLNAQPEQLRPHRYFRIPSALWTQGHIARLGGPGISMLLVLLCEQREAGNDVWFSPRVAKERFDLSPSTRSQGLQELRDLNLVDTRMKVTSEDGTYITFQRRRNVHRLSFK